MTTSQRIEVPVKGMDCAECVAHVTRAISGLEGVREVRVFLASEKAVIDLDPTYVDLTMIRKAVEKAGYSVPEPTQAEPPNQAARLAGLSRSVLGLFGLVFGAVMFVVVVGEWLGLFRAATRWVPWPIGVALVLAAGYPVFRNVVRAIWQRQVISHTLMTLGVIAALAVGEWPTAAVVACSCSFALATPIAMLASIGAAAKRGLLIKGGKYLEALARADVLLLDKTGTLTLGRPQITDVVVVDSESATANAATAMRQNDLLRLAATAERYSEHPLAEAVRALARERGITLGHPEQFEALPGFGVRAQVDGQSVVVGGERLVPEGMVVPAAQVLREQGKTLFHIVSDDRVLGVLGASDSLRPEVPAALSALRHYGLQKIELLTGDNEVTAAALAGALGITYRANMLPQDKIGLVQEYQRQGHVVVMVGDGVNDAPALAQAQVGIAMGAAGTAVALEAGHMALLREDWSLVPELFHIAQRTMRVVKLNIAFTAVYNVLGLSLAAFGILPPILAAAAQSLPDLGMLANSSRLLRQKRHAARERAA